MTIPLPTVLPRRSSCQPGPLGRWHPWRAVSLRTSPAARPLFGVAPGGACRAGPVASPAVGFYPTVSPLPLTLAKANLRSRQGQSLLCGAFPGVTPAGRYPAPLPTGVRTFLEAQAPRSSSPPRGVGLGFGRAGVNRNPGQTCGEGAVGFVQRPGSPGPEPQPIGGQQHRKGQVGIAKGVQVSQKSGQSACCRCLGASLPPRGGGLGWGGLRLIQR